MDEMQFTPGGMNNQGQVPNEQQISVDPSKLETFVCSECKNNLFQNFIIIKRISPVDPMNNTGKEMFIPMQVMSCTNCGNIPNEFGGKLVSQKEYTDNDTGPGL